VTRRLADRQHPVEAGSAAQPCLLVLVVPVALVPGDYGRDFAAVDRCLDTGWRV
jgi:hypothetical protein